MPIDKVERKGRRFRRLYKVSDAMDDVKEMVNGIDRRLGFHINIVSENLGKMTNLVEEVHEAIMDEDIGTKSFNVGFIIHNLLFNLILFEKKDVSISKFLLERWCKHTRRGGKRTISIITVFYRHTTTTDSDGLSYWRSSGFSQCIIKT